MYKFFIIQFVLAYMNHLKFMVKQDLLLNIIPFPSYKE